MDNTAQLESFEYFKELSFTHMKNVFYEYVCSQTLLGLRSNKTGSVPLLFTSAIMYTPLAKIVYVGWATHLSCQ